MRKFSNRLSAILAFVSLPLYLLVSLAAMAGLISLALTPDWLPSWLQFLATKTFVLIAFGLILWFVISTQLGAQRIGADMVWIDTLFSDDISGYLLFAGLIVAAIVLKFALG